MRYDPDRARDTENKVIVGVTWAFALGVLAVTVFVVSCSIYLFS